MKAYFTNYCLYFLICFFLSTSLSYSSPLTLEECLKTKAEHEALVNSGIPADIAKGSKYVSSSLPKDRLIKIKRWFVLQEQMLFRCPRLKTQKQDKPILNEAATSSGEGKKVPSSVTKSDEIKIPPSTPKKDT